eukprot:1158839-Pelagomonas_calceolata.AAC.13
MDLEDLVRPPKREQIEISRWLWRTSYSMKGKETLWPKGNTKAHSAAIPLQQGTKRSCGRRVRTST